MTLPGAWTMMLRRRVGSSRHPAGGERELGALPHFDQRAVTEPDHRTGAFGGAYGLTLPERVAHPQRRVRARGRSCKGRPSSDWMVARGPPTTAAKR